MYSSAYVAPIVGEFALVSQRTREGKKNFTTKLPRTTLGTGLARTGTLTQVHQEKNLNIESKERPQKFYTILRSR